MAPLKVAVIGAGASGLVTLKYLATAHRFFDIEPVDVRLFEAEDHMGGTFKDRVYEDAELVSSKYLTAFSDLRLPEDEPDFITPARYCQYFEDYVAKFGLEPYIHLKHRILSLRRHEDVKGHTLTILPTDGTSFTWTCDAVAICSGLHSNPEVPAIPGMEKVDTILHSSELKTRQQFGKDKSVMVLGAGETGMDICHLAITSPTKSVVLCHRNGFFCGPKIIPVPIVMSGIFSKPDPAYKNKPVDTSPASLFDTAYVHPKLQRSQWLWNYYNSWIKFSQTMISGTPNGPDQWVGRMQGPRNHVDSVFFVKSDRALPYLSAPYRSKSFLNRIRAALINVPIKDTGGRHIDVAPWPDFIDDEGIVHFQDNGREEYQRMQGVVVKPDVIVFATGYKKKINFLDDTYPDPQRVDVRGIYQSDDPTVAFIGFMRPGIGAIPPLSELQAQLWVLRLLQFKYPETVPTEFPNAVPGYEMSFNLHPREGYDLFTSKGGVDHESYAYQLALDMGAAPTFSFVRKKGFKVLYAWAMGANFNPKFRLVGPWKVEEEAEEIMRVELYGVVKRSGGVVYLFTFTLIPFVIFGTLSMVLHGLDGAVGGVKAVGRGIVRLFRRK